MARPRKYPEKWLERGVRLVFEPGRPIAHVAFLSLTSDLDAASRSRVIRQMLTTSGAAALVLVVLGECVARSLHFSTGSLSVAGGPIVLIISVTMVLGSADSERQHALREQDPMQVAVFPLAVPYLPVNDRLKPNSMLVTEKIFGFLPAALAVHLVLDGLAGVGVIHLSSLMRAGGGKP